MAILFSRGKIFRVPWKLRGHARLLVTFLQLLVVQPIRMHGESVHHIVLLFVFLQGGRLVVNFSGSMSILHAVQNVLSTATYRQ